MFVEMPKRHFEKLRPYLQEQGIAYEVSDCTMPGDTEMILYVKLPEFGQGLSQYQIDIINNKIDSYLFEDKELAKERDRDGDGISDYAEDLPQEERQPVRRKPWQDRMHTPLGEAVGYFTGESEREEIQ